MPVLGRAGKSAVVGRIAEDYADVLCLVSMVPVNGSVCFQRVGCSAAPVALATCLLSNAGAYGLADISV